MNFVFTAKDRKKLAAASGDVEVVLNISTALSD
jgi:hypothetical protein